MLQQIIKKKYDILAYITIFIAMIVIIMTSNLFNSEIDFRRKDLDFEKATILSVLSENFREDRTVPNLYIGHQEIEVEILTGKFAGEIHQIRNSMGRMYNVYGKEGMQVIVAIYEENNRAESVRIYNYVRSNAIFILVGLFFLVLILVGRIKGLKSILSLIFTGIMVVFYMLPAILAGKNPITVAIFTAIISIAVTFYVIGGWSKKTLAAIIGTALGVSIAGTVSYIAGNMAHLSGLTMDNAEQLLYVADETGLQLRGLMFAAILIASLGAIMDIGMSIASSISEIYAVNKKQTQKQLFKSGMNVGKDIIGTMANTLILAFAGGMLNMMLISMAYRMPYYQLMNFDLITTEIIQALAGSIGIVLTVPITAGITAMLISGKQKVGK